MGRYFIMGIFALSGLISLGVGLTGAKWFLSSSNARPVVQYLGLKGARIFYGVLGCILLAMAAWFLYSEPI